MMRRCPSLDHEAPAPRPPRRQPTSARARRDTRDAPGAGRAPRPNLSRGASARAPLPAVTLGIPQAVAGSSLVTDQTMLALLGINAASISLMALLLGDAAGRHSLADGAPARRRWKSRSLGAAECAVAASRDVVLHHGHVSGGCLVPAPDRSLRGALRARRRRSWHSWSPGSPSFSTWPERRPIGSGLGVYAKEALHVDLDHENHAVVDVAGRRAGGDTARPWRRTPQHRRSAPTSSIRPWWKRRRSPASRRSKSPRRTTPPTTSTTRRIRQPAGRTTPPGRSARSTTPRCETRTPSTRRSTAPSGSRISRIWRTATGRPWRRYAEDQPYVLDQPLSRASRIRSSPRHGARNSGWTTWTDPRLQAFIDRYAGNGPEPGATCDTGVEETVG